MSLALTVFEITAPVFILAALGFTWVRLGYGYDTVFVTRLAMTLAVPALVFSALSGSTLDPGAVGRMILATGLGYGILSVVALALCWGARLDLRTWLAPVIFGNTGNLGLPLCLFAFGEEGLALAVVFFSVGILFQFTIGLWVVAGGGSPWRAVQEPLVAAAVLGGLFLWQGWSVPRFLGDAIGLIGQMAIPLMLITLGVAVARLEIGRATLVSLLAVAKAVIAAGVGLGIAASLGLTGAERGVLVLQLATPVAVTSYLLAEKYGADASAVAGLVVVSTVLSIATLPALLTVVL